MTDIFEERLFALAEYYHECTNLIFELKPAFLNIQKKDNLEDIKIIADKALNLINEREDVCVPNLYPNGEVHTGHLYPEYYSVPLKHEIVFEPIIDVLSLYKSIGIK